MQASISTCDLNFWLIEYQNSKCYVFDFENIYACISVQRNLLMHAYNVYSRRWWVLMGIVLGKSFFDACIIVYKNREIFVSVLALLYTA